MSVRSSWDMSPTTGYRAVLYITAFALVCVLIIKLLRFAREQFAML